MEKHPIDSRFKQQLGNFQPQPSADAWARLQSRMNTAEPEVVVEEKEERKPLFMWYSIAAAIALLLISVGVYKVNFGTELNQTIAKTSKTEQVQKAKNTQPETETILKQENEAPELIASTQPSVQPEEMQAVKTESAKEEAKIQKEKTIKATESSMIAAGRPASKYKTEKANPAVKKEAPENKALPTDNAQMLAVNNTHKPETKPEVITAKPETGEALEITVIRSEPKMAVASFVEEKEEMGKLKPAKNIFKQARNLKNGEKVDLQQIGIDPNSKLAMETKNLKHNLTNTFTKVLEL